MLEHQTMQKFGSFAQGRRWASLQLLHVMRYSTDNLQFIQKYQFQSQVKQVKSIQCHKITLTITYSNNAQNTRDQNETIQFQNKAYGQEKQEIGIH